MSLSVDVQNIYSTRISERGAPYQWIALNTSATPGDKTFGGYVALHFSTPDECDMVIGAIQKVKDNMQASEAQS